jgi:hypothetical protein
MDRTPLSSFKVQQGEPPKEFPILNPPKIGSQPTTQPKEKSFLDKATGVAEGVTDTLGLGGVVDYYGNIGASMMEPELAQQGAFEKPSLKKAVGAGVQLGSLFSPGAKGAGLVQNVATNILQGAGSLGGQALAEGKDLGDAAQSAKSGGLLGGALGVAGKALSGLGKGIYKFIIPRGVEEAGRLQRYRADVPFMDRVTSAAMGTSKPPVTSAETAFSQGLVGTEGMLGVQARKASNEIWKGTIQPALDSSPVKVSMPQFFSDLENKIVKGNADLSRQKALLEALDAMKEDYVDVVEVPLKQLQKFKEGWAAFVPDKAYRGKPIAGAFRDVQNEAAALARDAIYTTLGSDVRRAYIDYGNLKAVQELGIKAMTGGKFKGGTGSFLTGLYEMAVTPVATIGGLTVYKTGEGIELLGGRGAATVGEVLDSDLPDTIQQTRPTPTGRRPLEEFQQ